MVLYVRILFIFVFFKICFLKYCFYRLLIVVEYERSIEKVFEKY